VTVDVAAFTFTALIAACAAGIAALAVVPHL
jgi:hypothetical protein